MDRLGATAAGGIEDRRDVQIAVPRRRRPDRPGLFGQLDMQRIPVCFGIDCHRRDPEPPRGANDPAGDFPTIGDQDLAEQAHIRKTPKRVGSVGALRLAEIANAKVIRVSAGSMTPSSHSRALA